MGAISSNTIEAYDDNNNKSRNKNSFRKLHTY